MCLIHVGTTAGILVAFNTITRSGVQEYSSGGSALLYSLSTVCCDHLSIIVERTFVLSLH